MEKIKNMLPFVMVLILLGAGIQSEAQENKTTYTKLIVALPLMNVSEKDC